MITVHGRASSANVQIVMWAIAELDLPYRRLDVGGPYGGHDKPEYLAMNPNGLVPVLQDGDLTMFESSAILRYLGARYGPEKFWPSDPARRAALDTWAEWAKTTFVPAMIPLFVQFVRTREKDRNAAAIEVAEANLAKVVRIADQRIGDGPFLAGDDLTFADIVFAHQLYRYATLPIRRVETQQLDTYYDRLRERPPYAEHVMVPYDELRIE